MRHIKLFESHSKLYEKISYQLYRDRLPNLDNFERKYGNRLLEMLKHYKETDLLMEYDKTGLYHQVVNKNGRQHDWTDEINYDEYSAVRLTYGKRILYDKYTNVYVTLNISQSKDEYFYVEYSYLILDRETPIEYYKCDQIEGLLQLVCDKIESRTI